ncbi:MAG: methyltransferase [Candidatus Thermoplasmatota archaeon]|nr:methyltransferase [Candidatus Thermoplasmatota archaeon]MCL5731092.1 methyltransferase [Candidatus Thermoplasmatota archaeon]
MIYRRDGFELEIIECESVYRPSDDSFLLADSFVPSGSVIEMGCGTGLSAVLSSKMGHETAAVDINPAAVRCTERNADLNSVHVRTYHSDLFSSVQGSYDTILFNPPYLPVDEDIEGSEQWAGGEDGFRVVRRFLDMLPSHMRPSGNCYIVLSDLADTDLIISQYPQYVFSAVSSRKMFFEEITLYRISMRNNP